MLDQHPPGNGPVRNLIPLTLSLSKGLFYIVLPAAALFHMLQQCIAGYIQCSALGCLPQGVVPW